MSLQNYHLNPFRTCTHCICLSLLRNGFFQYQTCKELNTTDGTQNTEVSGKFNLTDRQWKLIDDSWCEVSSSSNIKVISKLVRIHGAVQWRMGMAKKVHFFIILLETRLRVK